MEMRIPGGLTDVIRFFGSVYIGKQATKVIK
jgi:hypothetical protein